MAAQPTVQETTQFEIAPILAEQGWTAKQTNRYSHKEVDERPGDFAPVLNPFARIARGWVKNLPEYHDDNTGSGVVSRASNPARGFA